ncbi:PEP/pyruvate-binding domain-containing protein [Pseudomonadota bacterium]
MRNPILDWPDALKAGPSICGGKGWNLARLDHYGFEIPKGFVISAGVYSQLLATLTESNLHEAFMQATLPLQNLKAFLVKHGLENSPVAVRSSATSEDGAKASFAGIHESYLNVCGLDEIERAVLRCYASLWSERAISYRKKMNIGDADLACAVVVSELINAQASGVAFSCDPATGRDDLITINANFGLGESVVSGITTPDEYRVHYHQQQEITKQLGEKNKKSVTATSGTKLIDNPGVENISVLSNAQISQLSRLVLRVFHTLGKSEQHQDIEWILDGNKLMLTQARPVTALPSFKLPALVEHDEMWTAGNLRDALPMVMPTLSSGFSYYHINNILRYVVEGAGYVLPEGVNFCRRYEGRYYCNATLMQWLMYDLLDMPTRLTNLSLGGHHECMDIDDAIHSSAIKKAQRLWRSLKFVRYIDQHKKQAEQTFTGVRQYIDEVMQTDLSLLSDKQLQTLCYDVDNRLSSYDRKFIALTSASGAIFVIIRILEKKLADKAPNIANALLAGGASITSANQGYQIFELAELLDEDKSATAWFQSKQYQPMQWQTALPENSKFKHAFRDYLKQFGHRGVYEIDFTRPRWNEDPSYLLDSIKNAIGKSRLTEIRAKQKESAEHAWQLIDKKFSWVERKILRTMLARSLSGAETREMAKSVYVAFLTPVRKLMLELGKRLCQQRLINDTNDIIHCDFSEIASIINGEWSGETLANIVAERKEKRHALEALSAPDVIANNAPRYVHAKPKSNHKNQMQGVAVAPGVAEGKAHVAHTPEQGVDIPEGYVLVAPSTDPGWTPLFLHASALVMETGGYLSHGSIVAREYGIPAVVNVPGAMSAIQPGATLSVNGNQGTVEVTS